MEEPKVPGGFDFNTYWDKPQPEECKKNILQQVMIRCKEPKASLDFYTEVLGFTLVWA